MRMTMLVIAHLLDAEIILQTKFKRLWVAHTTRPYLEVNGMIFLVVYTDSLHLEPGMSPTAQATQIKTRSR